MRAYIYRIYEAIAQTCKRKKVFLVVDGHPIHKSKLVKQLVKQWVEANASSIELIFLPSYSPELNPDEFLNHDIKAQTVRKNPPENTADLIRMIRGHLRSRQKTPKIVARFFQAKSVQYAA